LGKCILKIEYENDCSVLGISECTANVRYCTLITTEEQEQSCVNKEGPATSCSDIGNDYETCLNTRDCDFFENGCNNLIPFSGACNSLGTHMCQNASKYCTYSDTTKKCTSGFSCSYSSKDSCVKDSLCDFYPNTQKCEKRTVYNGNCEVIGTSECFKSLIQCTETISPPICQNMGNCRAISVGQCTDAVNCDYFNTSPFCRDKVVYDGTSIFCTSLGSTGCKESAEHCFFSNNACVTKAKPPEGDCTKIENDNDCMKSRNCDYFGNEDGKAKCSGYIGTATRCSDMGKFFSFFFFLFLLLLFLLKYIILNRLGCELHSKTCHWDNDIDSCKDGAYCPTFNGKKYTCVDIEYVHVYAFICIIKLKLVLILQNCLFYFLVRGCDYFQSDDSCNDILKFNETIENPCQKLGYKECGI
jgi:hypothetical protein